MQLNKNYQNRDAMTTTTTNIDYKSKTTVAEYKHTPQILESRTPLMEITLISV